MRVQLLLAAVAAVALTACDGPKGAAGADGMDGENTAESVNGADGKDGAKGAKGADGTNGTNGTDGTDGTNGTDGTDGAKGAKGADGADGADGATGPAGNDVILSETARTGLEISAVELEGMTGLDGDAIESVGRGSYLVNAVADCTGCHNGAGPQGQTLFLAGNVDFPIGGFDPANPVTDCNVASPPSTCVDGHVFTRNLTPHKATGLKLSEDQFVKALRTGNDFKDATGGTTLIVMPWAQLRWLSDRDLHDIYHYLKHIPAIENAVQVDVKPVFPPPPSPFYAVNGDDVPVPTFGDGAVAPAMRPLPAAFDPEAGMPTAALGQTFDPNNVLRGLAISPLADDALVAGMSAADQQLYGRGSYIVNAPGLCNECHTPGGRNRDGTVKTATFLSGGQTFSVPPPLRPLLGQVRTMSADLTGATNGFTLDYAFFLQTWLSGMSFTHDPAHPHPLGFPMPFDTFRKMSDDDKLAVYTYITTIQDNAVSLGITGDVAHQAPSRYCTAATVADDCTGAGETCDATTSTCVGGTCINDSDCGACQTCTGGPKTCHAEDPTSACVLSSL